MTNISQSITNFTAGELSPRLLGRTDLKKYKHGVSKLENFLVQVHGGIERRPGTQFVASAAGSNTALQDLTRLVEFQYSVDQQYILEFGVDTAGAGSHGYIRFFRLDSSTGEPILLTDPDNSNNPTIKEDLAFRDTELETLRFAQSADVLYVFCPTRPIYTLKRTSTLDDRGANWTYTLCEHNDGPYLPLNSDELLTVKADGTTGNVTIQATHSTTASKQYIFVASDAHATHGRVIRLEDDSTGYSIKAFTPGSYDHDPGDSDGSATYGLWTTPATITIEDNGAMKSAWEGEVGTTGTEADRGMRVEFLKCASGLPELNDTVWIARNFTLTGGDSKFDLYHPDTGEAAGFRQLSLNAVQATETDGLCRFERAKHKGWGRITAVTDQSGSTGTYRTATVAVVDELPTKSSTTNFRLGAWSDSTGYPSTGRFFQDRLWSASTTHEPQTIWATGTGAYSCYSPTTVDEGEVIASSAITATIADSQVNKINHLVGDTSGLVVLTTGGEWMGRSSTATGAITPMDISFQKSSTYGASTLTPIQSGASTIFVQRDGTVARELTYDFGQDRFLAPAITLLSEHITGSGLKDMAYQQGKTNRFWLARTDGELVTLTYDKDEEVVAWHRQPMAVSGGSTAGQVLSVATTRDVGSDNVWLLVKRSITGSGTPAYKYYVEMLKQPLGSTEDHDLAWHLDSAETQYNGTAQQTWNNYNHLVGEPVYVFADARTLGPFTVNGSGQVDLGSGNTANRVTIGLRYSSVMETLPLVPEGVRGMPNPKGKLKRAYKFFVNLYRTLGGKIGTPDQVYDIEYDTLTSAVLNTQLFEVNAPDNGKRETIIRYEQQDGNPATLLSIVAEYDHGSV